MSRVSAFALAAAITGVAAVGASGFGLGHTLAVAASPKPPRVATLPDNAPAPTTSPAHGSAAGRVPASGPCDQPGSTASTPINLSAHLVIYSDDSRCSGLQKGWIEVTKQFGTPAATDGQTEYARWGQVCTRSSQKASCTGEFARLWLSLTGDVHVAQAFAQRQPVLFQKPPLTAIVSIALPASLVRAPIKDVEAATNGYVRNNQSDLWMSPDGRYAVRISLGDRPSELAQIEPAARTLFSGPYCEVMDMSRGWQYNIALENNPALDSPGEKTVRIGIPEPDAAHYSIKYLTVSEPSEATFDDMLGGGGGATGGGGEPPPEPPPPAG